MAVIDKVNGHDMENRVQRPAKDDGDGKAEVLTSSAAESSGQITQVRGMHHRT